MQDVTRGVMTYIHRCIPELYSWAYNSASFFSRAGVFSFLRVIIVITRIIKVIKTNFQYLDNSLVHKAIRVIRVKTSWC